MQVETRADIDETHVTRRRRAPSCAQLPIALRNRPRGQPHRRPPCEDWLPCVEACGPWFAPWRPPTQHCPPSARIWASAPRIIVVTSRTAPATPANVRAASGDCVVGIGQAFLLRTKGVGRRERCKRVVWWTRPCVRLDIPLSGPRDRIHHRTEAMIRRRDELCAELVRRRESARALRRMFAGVDLLAWRTLQTVRVRRVGVVGFHHLAPILGLWRGPRRPCSTLCAAIHAPP